MMQNIRAILYSQRMSERRNAMRIRQALKKTFLVKPQQLKKVLSGCVIYIKITMMQTFALFCAACA